MTDTMVDVEAAKAVAERIAQGLTPRLEDRATQSRILTALKATKRYTD